MGSPRPSFGRAKNYDPKGRYEYGRLGGPRFGQNNFNSYMEAGWNGEDRSSTRLSFPVFTGDWKTFVKNCLPEAHVAGVNEALTIASKAHQKQWHWPFATDPRQECGYSSEEDEIEENVKTEYATRANKAKKGVNEVQMGKIPGRSRHGCEISKP